MIDVFCKKCGTVKHYSTEGEARKDGWDSLSVTGVTGPWANESKGLCPNCN